MIAFLHRYLGFGPFALSRAGDPDASRHPSRGHVDMEDLTIAQRVHDLRSDVTLIIGCAERIASLVPRGYADEPLTELRRCTERAALLSRELLLAQRNALARHRVDLNHVIGRTAAIFSRVAGDEVRVRLQLSSEPLFVDGDVTELERIFLNLALNAREAMGVSGVLTFQTATVDVPPGQNDGTRPGRQARVTVTDTGSGMSTDVMTHIFEPFFTTTHAGAGLGLSSVAYRVREMNGTVSLKSEIGVGTSVTVSLPLLR